MASTIPNPETLKSELLAKVRELDNPNIDIPTKLKLAKRIKEIAGILNPEAMKQPIVVPGTSSKIKLDLSLPDKLPGEVIVQLKEDGSDEWLAQMNEISAKPDYDLLSNSRSFYNGSPVVSYGVIKEEAFGKLDRAVLSPNKNIPVQYAVIEADDVLTSHDFLGSAVEEFFEDDPHKIRAIEGNKRLAGIKEAYKKGTAEGYRQHLIEEAPGDYQIDRSYIERLKDPVLVRVMQPKDVTNEI